VADGVDDRLLAHVAERFSVEVARDRDEVAGNEVVELRGERARSIAILAQREESLRDPQRDPLAQEEPG
jgi:hypothetical protein